MTRFDQLTPAGQARRIRPLALTALTRWGFRVRRLRLLGNDNNCVFRVDTSDGRKYVLRVTSPGARHSLPEIRAETHWLRHLHERTDLPVPDPVPARDGSLVTTARADGVPEPRHCALFRWIPGSVLGDRLTPGLAGQLGAISARLHEAAQGFRLPAGLRTRAMDTVLPYCDREFPNPEPAALLDPATLAGEPRRIRDTYDQAVDAVRQALSRLYGAGEKPHLLHNDLHPWNAKVDRGRVRVIDFEEIMWGFAAQDVAATFYYLWLRDDWTALRDAYRDGYAAVRDWPEAYAGQLSELMAARALLLVNYVLASDEPRHREMASEYLVRVAKRLRKLLS